MSQNTSQITRFSWQIDDFHGRNCQDNMCKKFSEQFALTNQPLAKFSVFYIPPASWWFHDAKFGICLKRLSENCTFEVNVNICVKDQNGSVKGSWTAQNHHFKRIGDECTFLPTANESPEEKFIYTTYKNRSGLLFSCEIECIRVIFPAVQSASLLFRKKLWDRYKIGLKRGIKLSVDGQQYMVDECVLTSQVEPFAAALTPNYQENEDGKIVIDDFDPMTVKAFIKWLYLGTIDLSDLSDLPDSSDQVVKNLLVFADKYNIQELKNLCAEFLADNLNNSNASEHLILSITYNSEALKTSVFGFLSDKQPVEIMRLILSSNWHEYASNNKEQADAVMEEIYSMVF